MEIRMANTSVSSVKWSIPMGLQYSITAIGSVVLQTGINTLGSAAVASVSAASKLSMFLACPFDAISFGHGNSPDRMSGEARSSVSVRD